MAEKREADSAARRLDGRKVLVIGAGTRPDDDPESPVGNGRAIAVLAAREGGSVACADVAAQAAGATAELVSAEGVKGVAVVGDATDAEQSAAVVDEAAHALGGLDGLVVNVGIGLGTGLEGSSPRTGTAFSLSICGRRSWPPSTGFRRWPTEARSSSSGRRPGCVPPPTPPPTTVPRRDCSASSAMSRRRRRSVGYAPTSSSPG